MTVGNILSVAEIVAGNTDLVKKLVIYGLLNNNMQWTVKRGKWTPFLVRSLPFC